MFDEEIIELKLKFDRIYDWKKESFHSLPYVKECCAYQDTVKKIAWWRNHGIKIKIWSNLWSKKESFNSLPYVKECLYSLY